MSAGNLELRSTTDAVQAALDAGMALGVPQQLEPGTVNTVVIPAGATLHLQDLTGDQYLDAPKRKKGLVVLRDAASFNAYWDKHRRPESEVYADLDTHTVTAVIDAGLAATDGDAAGWGGHRARLDLRETVAWKAWAAHDGKLLEQVAFAEHIEDRLIDIDTPSGADMLEIAQSFQATTQVSFESGTQVSSGQRTFVYKENTEAGAGRMGELTIPTTFKLGLQPFEGSDPYGVTCRFRYRIGGGSLKIGYAMERPEDVLAAAFGDILDAIEGHVGTPVLRGNPAPQLG